MLGRSGILVAALFLLSLLWGCSAAPPVPTPTPIPPTATPVGRVSTEPTPSSEVRLELGGYVVVDSGGSPLFLGEVVNNGAVAAGEVKVTVSLLDEKGRLEAVGDVNLVKTPRVEPNGGRFPFKILVLGAPKKWSEARFDIQGKAYSGNPIFPDYFDLTVDDVALKKPASPYEPYRLAGRVINVGDRTSIATRVVATLYDKDGKVIDVGSGMVKIDAFPPQGNVPFELDFIGLGNSIPATWGILVSGRPRG